MLDKIKTVIKYPSLFFYYLFNLIENNNNYNIEKNGEGVFIGKFFDCYQSKKFKKPLIVFDLGAAEGEYFQKVLDLSDRLQVQIHAFEPSVYSYHKLVNKYKDVKTVLINNFAVSDKAGTSYLYFNKQGSVHGSLIKRSNLVISMNKRSKVKKIILEKYIKENKIKHIHLLKMDIEGSEMNALKGLGKYLDSNFIDFFQFEYGGTNLDSRTNLQDFYSVFTKKGFELTKILRNRLQKRGYHQWMDNFQMSNYVAISKNITSNIMNILC
ncbi:MAG: FkbM family methyltransferase [Ignavibacteriales bacterium]|nr:FkbM family methyltransferase [Ignavibacteriales bacterium]